MVESEPPDHFHLTTLCCGYCSAHFTDAQMKGWRNSY